MKNFLSLSLLISICLSSVTVFSAEIYIDSSKKNEGLTLPDGFSAEIIATDLKNARHLAVTDNGHIYVKLERLKDKKGIYLLQDVNKDGQMEIANGFGDYTGTGIAIKNGYLYASSNTTIYRYKINEDGHLDGSTAPETIVTGLIDKNEHASKSITLDNEGNIYVNIGAYSNACQEANRTKGSPGMQPCPILEHAGGIWKFSANKQNQSYADGSRYATGLRNVVGLDWNSNTNSLFVMQHGRDQLHDLYPELYSEKESAELPAECMYELKEGDNAGWPYIYYDQIQNKKMIAPEYGGDGKKEADSKYIDPVVAFPGHLAPNGLVFYTGTAFPEKYRNGAFIAFHGSWNRAPLPQKGYFVAFVPFKDGKPNGDWEIFADGFAGMEVVESPGDAVHRPCGITQGNDGALYVTDDVKGAVYKITYKG